MKRITFVLIVVVAMLVVVASASAATVLRGTMTGGTGYRDDGVTTVILKSGGAVKVTAGSFTAANFVGQITIDEETPLAGELRYPFPMKLPATTFHWVWGFWDEEGTVYTAYGHFVRPTLPPFEANLTADTGAHTLTIEIITNYSSWHWARWVLTGDLQ